MRAIAFIIVISCATVCFTQAIPPNEAAQVFAVAADINQHDTPMLWGMPVCGPILLADPATHEVVANQADAEGKLQRSGQVWIGKLPKEQTPANTATDWAGARWTMLVWPITEDARDRRRLIAHECFHRIQPALHLQLPDVVNAHLDKKDGRIWLQLEWRALERAVMQSGPQRQHAVADALLFRAYRRLLFPNAATNENALELNEGLSEYTGVRLGNDNEVDRRAAVVYRLVSGPSRKNFARSFAYISGPAYGVLLDESKIPWRTKLTAKSDLGALLAAAYKIPQRAATETVAAQAAGNYGGDELIAAENERQKKQDQQIAEMKKLYVEGPVLVLPAAGKFSYGFNPDGVISLDENSSVYTWLRVTDTWGVMEANGALLVRENGKISRVIVPLPKENEPDGWKLELDPQWERGAGPRSGDQTLTKK